MRSIDAPGCHMSGRLPSSKQVPSPRGVYDEHTYIESDRQHSKTGLSMDLASPYTESLVKPRGLHE